MQRRVVPGSSKHTRGGPTTHGARAATAKYNLMHLTRKTKRFNLRATVNISGFYGAPCPVVRILGVLVDSKLRWSPHVKYDVQTESRRRIAAMNRIMASTWGATFSRAWQIYTAVVRPKSAYGCSTWHTPKDTDGRSSYHHEEAS